MANSYGRVITAMVTPMTSDLKVDYPRAAQLARHLIENGSDGLVLTGTTGESPTLSDDEKLRLYATVMEEVGGEAFVWAGTGSYDTAASIELSRRALKEGVDGIMLVVPYYNKPPQSGLYAHFSQIADAVDKPVLMYNIPGRTGVNMQPETIARLAEHPNIVAIKESALNMEQAAEIRRLCPPDFVIYSGEDSYTLPMLALGAAGVVSVAAHLVGNELSQMIEAFAAGDNETALKIHLRLMPLFKCLFLNTNPIPLKYAMGLAGFSTGPTRPPLVEPDENTKSRLRQVLADLNLLAPERDRV